MPERPEIKAVERSCRFFRRLLVLYPKAHREEYGPAILQLFRDQCRDAWTAAGVRGLIGFWLCALTDLLKTSVWEHLSNANRRKLMPNLSRPKFLLIFTSVFAAVFLLTLGGSTFVTLIFPKTYASSARVLVRFADPQTPVSRSLSTEIAVLQSHEVLSKAGDALSLGDVWGKKYNNGGPLSGSIVEDMLKTRLDIRWVRNTDVIEIRGYSDSPGEAAKLANAVVNAYQQTLAKASARDGGVSIPQRVSIIDNAVPNTKPVRPNVPLNIVMGAFIGIAMGGISGTLAVGVMWLLGRRPANPGHPIRSADPGVGV